MSARTEPRRISGKLHKRRLPTVIQRSGQDCFFQKFPRQLDRETSFPRRIRGWARKPCIHVFAPTAVSSMGFKAANNTPSRVSSDHLPGDFSSGLSSCTFVPAFASIQNSAAVRCQPCGSFEPSLHANTVLGGIFSRVRLTGRHCSTNSFHVMSEGYQSSSSPTIFNSTE